MLTIDLVSHLTHEGRVLDEVIKNMQANVDQLSDEKMAVMTEAGQVNETASSRHIAVSPVSRCRG